jgi:hypothetical protein
MEPIIVGALAGTTAVLGVGYWQLLVGPDRLLSLWGGRRDEGWFEHHPAALRGLVISLGVVLFLSGFLTGLALTFLTGTS